MRFVQLKSKLRADALDGGRRAKSEPAPPFALRATTNHATSAQIRSATTPAQIIPTIAGRPTLAPAPAVLDAPVAACAVVPCPVPVLLPEPEAPAPISAGPADAEESATGGDTDSAPEIVEVGVKDADTCGVKV